MILKYLIAKYYKKFNSKGVCGIQTRIPWALFVISILSEVQTRREGPAEREGDLAPERLRGQEGHRHRRHHRLREERGAQDRLGARRRYCNNFEFPAKISKLST